MNDDKDCDLGQMSLLEPASGTGSITKRSHVDEKLAAGDRVLKQTSEQDD